MKLVVDLTFSDETVMAIASAANHNQKSIPEWIEYCVVLHTEMFHATDAGGSTPPLTDPYPTINGSPDSETNTALQPPQ